MSGPISPEDEAAVEAKQHAAERAWQRRCTLRQRRAQVGLRRRLEAEEVTALRSLEWQRVTETARPW